MKMQKCKHQDNEGWCKVRGEFVFGLNIILNLVLKEKKFNRLRA